MGVPLSAVVEMADLEDGVNTVTAYGADGFGQPLPLRYALEKNALLVYQVNGQELEAATGSSLQLWMPETVARYFTRDIVNIELTQEDAEPDVQQVDPCYRNKINIMNYSDDCVFKQATRSRSKAWPTIWEAPSPPSSSHSTTAARGRRATPTAPRPTSG